MACRGASRLAARRALHSIGTPGALLSAYEAAVQTSRLRPDAVQASAAHSLQLLQNGALQLDSGEAAGTSARGVYIHGPVGGGKSMLMDIFYETSDGTRPKRRMHFHELMVDVHQRLHAVHTSRPKRVVLTEQGHPIFRFGDAPDAAACATSDAQVAEPPSGSYSATASPAAAGEPPPPPPPRPDPLQIVASGIVAPGSLLCLDEMQVTDVADAMILRRLFEMLIDEHGVDVVFTSNRPPEGLYDRGLNRKYFLPFVALVRNRLAVLEVGGSIDYRTLPPPPPAAGAAAVAAGGGLHALAPRTPGSFHHGPGADAALRALWDAHAGAPPGAGTPPRELAVSFGRTLSVARHACDAACFSFAELCAPAPGARPLGASDYHSLARAFRHVYVWGVPVLSLKDRNEARRFVVLVDALYEARCTLHAAAAAPLAELLAPLLEAEQGAGGEMAGGAEVAVDEAGQHSLPFEAAAVGGRYTRDGELAAFFTAKDEVYMLKRTLSRVTEMCKVVPVAGSGSSSSSG